MSKYNYEQLAKKTKWSEKELNAFLRHIRTNPDDDSEAIFYETIDREGEIELTNEQQLKGKKWLINLLFTPTGRIRSNHPFGAREIDIINNLDYISLIGFFDAGNFFSSFYVPLYEACGNGYCMQYYVSGGKINIIG